MVQRISVDVFGLQSVSQMLRLLQPFWSQIGIEFGNTRYESFGLVVC